MFLWAQTIKLVYATTDCLVVLIEFWLQQRNDCCKLHVFKSFIGPIRPPIYLNVLHAANCRHEPFKLGSNIIILYA